MGAIPSAPRRALPETVSPDPKQLSVASATKPTTGTVQSTAWAGQSNRRVISRRTTRA
jgi:hypothetical protein